MRQLEACFYLVVTVTVASASGADSESDSESESEGWHLPTGKAAHRQSPPIGSTDRVMNRALSHGPGATVTI